MVGSRTTALRLRDPNFLTNQRNHNEMMSRVRAESATVAPIEGKTQVSKYKMCVHERRHYYCVECGGVGVSFANSSISCFHTSHKLLPHVLAHPAPSCSFQYMCGYVGCNAPLTLLFPNVCCVVVVRSIPWFFLVDRYASTGANATTA